MGIRRGMVLAALLAGGLVAAAVAATPATGTASGTATRTAVDTAAGTTTATAAGTVASTPYCGITWGSANRSGGSLHTAHLVRVSTARYTCFDRVIFEFDGPANGFRAGYRESYTQGQGLAMSPYVAGGAYLDVVLLEPATAATGQHMVRVVGYRTLRDVVSGGSFEGYTTMAVGARARLPYRVFLAAGPGTHSRIILDIAHRWTA
jgi:hypothetical protein